jgi:hypothetical protein
MIFICHGAQGFPWVEYPQLAHEDVLAAIAYGAQAARERIIPIPVDRVG